MSNTTEERPVMSFRLSRQTRHAVEQLAARLTIAKGRRHTLTDVIEEGIRLLAKRQGLKIEE